MPSIDEITFNNDQIEEATSTEVEYEYECNMCDMGHYLSWISTGTKFLYYVLNGVSIFECMHMFTWLTFIPSLIVMSCEIAEKMDVDCPMCARIHDKMSQIYYESWTAMMTQQIAMSPLYFFVDDPRFFLSDSESESDSDDRRRWGWRNDSSSDSDSEDWSCSGHGSDSESDSESDSSSSSSRRHGRKGYHDRSGFHDAGLERIPFGSGWGEQHDFEMLHTISWWTKTLAVIIKQYCEPFLKFDEVTLIKIATNNFIIDMWSADLEYALGVLTLEAPWMALLWYLFDRDIYESQPYQLA